MSSYQKNIAKKQVKQLPQNKKFDVIVYADYGCTTGFGNVTKEFINNWKKQIADKPNYEITIFAINNFEKEAYKIAKNVTVLPANIAPYNDPNDAFQRVAFLSMLQNIDYNVVFMLQDIEIVGTFSKDLKLINRDKKKLKRLQYKTVFYFPIDSTPRKEDLGFLDTFDEIVSYTNYAKDTITELAPEPVSKKLQIIPHGVDTKTFKKLPETTVMPIKEKLFGKEKYVIGTVNRNSARKDLGTLLLAFVEFKKDFQNLQNVQDKLVLYMHCNPEDTAGIHLRMLAARIGLIEGKDIFFPNDFSENKGYSEKELNELYNCMDVFVTTSTAEGWGLTVTEAMAAETLVIAPMHTSLTELCLSPEHGQLAIITPTARLEPTVFVHDGDKVRFKTLVNDLKNKLHFAFDIESNFRENFIRDAKKSLKKYNWTDSANAMWSLINKYLK